LYKLFSETYNCVTAFLHTSYNIIFPPYMYRVTY
jgi:hypothetical protein